MTNSSRTVARALLNIPPPAGSRLATSYSRIIPAEELGHFDAWNPGALAATAVRSPGSLPGRQLAHKGETVAEPPTAEHARAQAAEAHRAGYEEGYRDGLAALEDFKRSHAEQVQAQAADQLGQWIAGFEAEWSQLEPQMAQTLARTAVRLGRQVLRQELKTHPEHVMHMAHEAVQAIGQSARRIELRVHPDDLPLVQQAVGATLATRGAQLSADSSLSRGSCRVQADIAAVDATLERRWAEATAALGSPMPLHEEPPASP